VVSSLVPRLVFSHSVNCVLYKVHQASVLPYASSNRIIHRANLWRTACIYVITTRVMVPHIRKTGDTTHEASFHVTVSVMLLIHAVLMADR